MAADRVHDSWIHSAKVAARVCPVCQRVLDASTGVSLNPNETRPVLGPNDVTCCAYCGTILVTTTIGFRLAADDDLARLHPDLRRLLYAYAGTLNRRPPQ